MTVRYRRLTTLNRLQGMMTRHYAASRYLGKLHPVAWLTSGAPVEIIRAMGIMPVYPENYGAICGARRVAADLCQEAEQRGYSRELCSYAKCHLASLYVPKRAPMGGLPRPSVLVACNNICGTVTKWYQALARELDVPLFLWDTPFSSGGLRSHAIDYAVTQLEDMIRFLEKHTGRRLRPEKLKKVVGLSQQASRLWQEIRDMGRHRPSPVNASDLFIAMAPIVTLRGTREAVDFYRDLKEELAERVKRGEGALPEEKYRLVWDNIAIWHKLLQFYGIFINLRACFVADTYTGGWGHDLAGEDILASLARTYTGVFLNRGLEYRAEQMVELVQDFGAHGFVMHANRSCRPYTLLQYDIRRIVTLKTGVPGLIVEADMSDPRLFAEEAVKTRIQAFMETLEA